MHHQPQKRLRQSTTKDVLPTQRISLIKRGGFSTNRKKVLWTAFIFMAGFLMHHNFNKYNDYSAVSSIINGQKDHDDKKDQQQHQEKDEVHLNVEMTATTSAVNDVIGKEESGEIRSYNPNSIHLKPTKSIQDITDTACRDKPGEGREGNSRGYDALVKIREGIAEAGKEIGRLSSSGKKKPPRILCMIYTYSKNEKLVEAIVNTWGPKCDGFLAVSNSTNRDFGILEVPHQGEESYSNMWQKVRSMWGYAYDNYLDSYDYFHICGDDTFVVIDNLRSYLMSPAIENLLNGTQPFAFHPKYEKEWDFDKNPNRPLLLGQPAVRGQSGKVPVFPAGGPGYTLNRAALELFGSKIMHECLVDNIDSREDVFVGGCFWRNSVLTADTRDEDHAFRYLSLSPNFHANMMTAEAPWCPKRLQEMVGFEIMFGLDSVSNQSVAFHLKDTGDSVDELVESMYRHHAILSNLCEF